jgi:ABC-type glycerol-3-phosphate transport system permease component
MRQLTVAARYLAILAAGLLMATPLVFMVTGALKTKQEILSFPIRLLPESPVWSNFSDAWAYLTPQVIGNTFAFTLGIVGLQLMLALPAAFALAKIPFRWTAVIMGILIVPLFVPSNLTLIPLFIVTFKLGWLNTFAGLVVPMAAQSAFAILLFRQFFVTLPPGLIEAARIDGASWFRVFRSVALPLAKPAFATYFSVSFLTAWNLYIWPFLIAPNPEHRVLNVALAPLANADNYATYPPGVGFAGAVIIMLPILVVFIVFQKWYINGVGGTGLE